MPNDDISELPKQPNSRKTISQSPPFGGVPKYCVEFYVKNCCQY